MKRDAKASARRLLAAGCTQISITMGISLKEADEILDDAERTLRPEGPTDKLATESLA